MPTAINHQPKEPIQHSPSGQIQVHHIWKTIQGEGPFAGIPAVFVRVTGCNLQCPACDTEYTSKREAYHAKDLAGAVGRFALGGLVVFTGGEPMRQNIMPAVKELLDRKYIVQVETNGTCWVEGLDHLLPTGRLSIVLSPKTPKIHPIYGEVCSYGVSIRNHAHAYKYVLRAGEVDPKDGLPTVALGGHRPARPPGPPELQHMLNNQIYLQPLDEQDEQLNRKNLDACIASCMKYGWRIGLQTHKLMGLE